MITLAKYSIRGTFGVNCTSRPFWHQADAYPCADDMRRLQPVRNVSPNCYCARGRGIAALYCDINNLGPYQLVNQRELEIKEP
jgi:hypothetical protein